MTKDEYLALITSEHSGKPKFEATVGATVAPLARLQEVLGSLIKEFDIDSAVGVQLDIIGQWVGRPRRIDTPLIGVYFSWDGAVDDGWESGVWKGAYDPISGLVDLPDDSYRRMLKAKIAANGWDGTAPSAYLIWGTIFQDKSHLLIQDNQDMTIAIGVSGELLSSVDKAVLINGLIPLKPEGVRIEHYAFVPASGPMFLFDSQPSNATAGWDLGQWSNFSEPI